LPTLCFHETASVRVVTEPRPTHLRPRRRFQFERSEKFGLAAGLTHVVTDPSSSIPTVGASGAIVSVLGAYFVLFPTARIITLVPILFLLYIVEIPAVFYLGVWCVS
jgi:hypothetical protein